MSDAIDPKVRKEFFRAVKHGATPVVSAMVTALPALVHITEPDGSTPLHFAAWKGHPEVATVLLDAGAEVDAQNQNEHWGGTPLHAAAHGNQKALAEILLERGADVNAVSCNNRKPMDETTFHKATAAAGALRRHGAVTGG